MFEKRGGAVLENEEMRMKLTAECYVSLIYNFIKWPTTGNNNDKDCDCDIKSVQILGLVVDHVIILSCVLNNLCKVRE